jgi:putative oxidoreductase
MKNILKLEFLPLNGDLGLLVLRVWMGLSLFVMHGIEKIFHFSHMLNMPFPDPLHIGSGVSLVYAMVSDAVCSILVMLGIFTRLAAALIVINLLVVFIFMHGFSFGQEHGQLVYVYLGGYIAILASGPGKYSLDSFIK